MDCQEKGRGGIKDDWGPTQGDGAVDATMIKTEKGREREVRHPERVSGGWRIQQVYTWCQL